MIFLIVEDLLLTTNIEELRENSDRPTTTKDGEYCTGSTLFIYFCGKFVTLFISEIKL
jgi:hypothetical protein